MGGGATDGGDTCGPTTDSCISPEGSDYADDGLCDAPLYCLCDYADCIGQDPPPFDGWPTIVGYGPATLNWKMATVRAWGESPVGTWRLEISDTRNPLQPEECFCKAEWTDPDCVFETEKQYGCSSCDANGWHPWCLIANDGCKDDNGGWANCDLNAIEGPSAAKAHC